MWQDGQNSGINIIQELMFIKLMWKLCFDVCLMYFPVQISFWFYMHLISWIFMFCFSVFHTLAHFTLSYLVLFHSDITTFTYLSNSLFSKFIIPPKSNLCSYWLSLAVLYIWNLVFCDTWQHDSVPNLSWRLLQYVSRFIRACLLYCITVCLYVCQYVHFMHKY